MADHEEDIDSDEECLDPIEYLGSLLQTEEGENIADVLKQVAKHLENQNKLLIKIVSALAPPKTS